MTNAQTNLVYAILSGLGGINSPLANAMDEALTDDYFAALRGAESNDVARIILKRCVNDAITNIVRQVSTP